VVLGGKSDGKIVSVDVDEFWANNVPVVGKIICTSVEVEVCEDADSNSGVLVA